MSISASTIQPKSGAKKTAKRVGRGNGSGKGTYAARGLKGQRARSGGKGGTQLRGFKQSLQKVPKLRGFKSMHAKAQAITLGKLSKVAKEGETLTAWELKKRGVIADAKAPVKIVSGGTIDKAVELKGCLATKSALEQIEKAGGKLVA